MALTDPSFKVEVVSDEFFDRFPQLNRSLPLVLEPPSEAEAIAITMHTVAIGVAFLVMVRHWYIRRSLQPKLKISMALFHLSFLVSMPLANACLRQVNSIEQRYVMFRVMEVLYCQVLTTSYIVLYAKQDSLLTENVKQMMSGTFHYRYKIVNLLFKLALPSYFAFSLLVFAMDTTTVYVRRVTEDFQSVVLVYSHPVYFLVLVPLGDCPISSLSLLMFLLPIQEMHKAAQSSDTTGNRGNNFSKKLVNTAVRNFNWSVVAVASTAVFLCIGGATLQPDYHVFWTVWGGYDVLLNVICIDQSFGKTSRNRSRNGRSYRVSPGSTKRSSMKASNPATSSSSASRLSVVGAMSMPPQQKEDHP